MANMNIYRPIAPIAMALQLSIPTVYSEALSYLEGESKLNFKVNELILSQNGIPALITDMINKRFDDAGIQEEIKNILAENVIDAKNPPDNLPPVTGDGTTNDTANLQAILDYAANLAATSTPKVVSLPAGTYLLDTIHLNGAVSLIGETCFTTILKAADFANVSIISGNLENAVLGNIGLDANSVNNPVFPPVLDLTTETGEAHIQNVRVVNCGIEQSALQYQNKGYLLIDNFTSVVGSVEISGKGIASLHILYLDGSKNGLTISSNHAVLWGGIFQNCTTAITLEGNFISAALRTIGGGLIVDKATDNSISASRVLISDYVETLDFTADTSIVNLGDSKISASYADITVDGNLSMEAAERNIIITGGDTLNAVSRIENIINEKKIVADNLNLEIGDRIQIAGDNIFASVAKFKSHGTEISVSAQKFTSKFENVTASVQKFSVYCNTCLATAQSIKITADNITEDAAEDIRFKAKNLSIETTNPIKYQAARKLDDNFNYITFLSPNGETIQVLVYNGTPLDPGGGGQPVPTVSPIYTNVKDKGAVGDGVTDDTAAFVAAGETNGFIFVPYGTYLVDTFTVTSSCKGIIGEMSTIKSATTTGKMIQSGGEWLSIANVQLSAPMAVSVLSAPDGVILNNVFIEGDMDGQIIMSNCRVINSGSVRLEGIGRLVNNIFSGNIIFTPSITYQITGNQVQGVLELVGVTEDNKITGLAITGNYFNNTTMLTPDTVENLRITGNVNLDDYPEVSLPNIPDPWDYNVPINQAVTYGNSYRQMVPTGGTDFITQVKGTEEGATWEDVIRTTTEQILLATMGIKLINNGGNTTISKYVNEAWEDILNIGLQNNLWLYSPVTIQNLVKYPVYSGQIYTNAAGDNAFKVQVVNGNLLAQVWNGESWQGALQLTPTGGVQFAQNISAPNIPTGINSDWIYKAVDITLGIAVGNTATATILDIPELANLYNNYSTEAKSKVIILGFIITGVSQYAQVQIGRQLSNVHPDNNLGFAWSNAVTATASSLQNLSPFFIGSISYPEIFRWKRTTAVNGATSIRWGLIYKDFTDGSEQPDPEPEPEKTWVTYEGLLVTVDPKKWAEVPLPPTLVNKYNGQYLDVVRVYWTAGQSTIEILDVHMRNHTGQLIAENTPSTFNNFLVSSSQNLFSAYNTSSSRVAFFVSSVDVLE